MPRVRRPESARRRMAGLTYIEVLCGMSMALVMVSVCAVSLRHGARLAEASRARTQALNAAQSELERLRMRDFDDLAGYAVDNPPIRGEVFVEPLPPRGKRLIVALHHADYPGQDVWLVTDVHQEGLTP